MLNVWLSKNDSLSSKEGIKYFSSIFQSCMDFLDLNCYSIWTMIDGQEAYTQEEQSLNKEKLNNGLVFSEKLPTYPHLTVVDIQQIERSNLGLRTTNPQKINEELTQGVAGDFLLLKAKNFLDIDEQHLEQISPILGLSNASPLILQMVKQGLIEAAFRGEDRRVALENLKGVEDLPQKYEEALSLFFAKRAQPALAMYQQVTPTMNLEEYINGLTKVVPAILIIQDSGERKGYDQERYFGFPKHGKDFITPDRIKTSSMFADTDVVVLKRRYNLYLQENAGKTGFDPQEPSQRLFKRVEADVTNMLVGKTVTVLRQIIAAS